MVRTFDFLCENGHVTDYFSWDGVKPETIDCQCGSKAMHVWLSAPGISPDRFWPGVNVKGFGYITSREQKNEILKRTGQAEVEPGWKDAINTVRKDAEKKYKAEQKQELIDTLFHGKDRNTPLDPSVTDFGKHEMDSEALEEISNA